MVGGGLIVLGIGIILGILSGLFGVGGSSITTPWLRLLGYPPMIALGSPLPVTFLTALVGGGTYWRKKCVRTKMVLWTAGGGVIGVIPGAYLTKVISGEVLMLLTGIVVTLIGCRVLFKVDDLMLDKPEIAGKPLGLFGTGIIIGILSGLLANGGGFLLMPAFLVMFRLPPREAAGTSLVSVGIMSLPGSWAHWHLGNVDPMVTMWLALGVIPTTYLGARVGLRLKQEIAYRLFGTFLILFGLFFAGRTLYLAWNAGWAW